MTDTLVQIVLLTGTQYDFFVPSPQVTIARTFTIVRYTFATRTIK